jgi:acyl carrier protein
MVTKVMDIVKQQLALKDDANLTADSKFTDLGADSLDTVRGSPFLCFPRVVSVWHQ